MTAAMWCPNKTLSKACCMVVLGGRACAALQEFAGSTTYIQHYRHLHTLILHYSTTGIYMQHYIIYIQPNNKHGSPLSQLCHLQVTGHYRR
jgi:hypothetical protein